MTCELCRSSEDPSPNRIGGIDMCRRCYDGGAVAAARARGFGLGVKCSHFGSGDKRVFLVNGTGSVGNKQLFNASFRRKGIANLAMLLGMTIRVQDPLFHKLGVIVSTDKARTRRFIDNDGAQSAVMDLLGEDVNIKIKNTGQVHLSGSRKHDQFDQGAIERELAVLLVHLDRFADG